MSSAQNELYHGIDAFSTLGHLRAMVASAYISYTLYKTQQTSLPTTPRAKRSTGKRCKQQRVSPEFSYNQHEPAQTRFLCYYMT